jgi:tRNA(Ile)-lysidine synthase
VEFVRQLREAGQHARPRLECAAYALQRYRDGVFLLPWREAPGPPEAPLELAPGQALELADGSQVGLVPVAAQGFALAEGETVELRWRQGGERCHPVTRDHSLPLKQLLQEAAIPPWWRPLVPLVFHGEELLAVADLTLCRSNRTRQLPVPGETLWQLSWRGNSAPEPIEPGVPF